MFGLNNYRKRRMLEIDIEVQEYRNSFKKEIEDLALVCARDKGDYEHEFHSAKERLGIDIAKLEASKELLEKDKLVYKQLLEEKDKEIKRIHELCSILSAPRKVTIKK